MHTFFPLLLCFFFSIITAFLCPEYCNYHGQCLAQGLCNCHDGWSGPSCASATCPSATAWSDHVTATDVAHALAVCSNRGHCDDLTGTCLCSPGFEGEACERTSCNCNGHGTCLSNKNYAEQDVGAGTIFLYDSNWDSDKIVKCVCDDGYLGSQCNERRCPTGDDPLTGGVGDSNGLQVNEKQVVKCAATGGTFLLSFRGYTTTPISFSETTENIMAVLLALPSINGVAVTFGGVTTTACTELGNDITIEFTQDFGDVPYLVLDGSSLVHGSGTAIFTPSTFQEGSKENIDCSGRGLCDSISGMCLCFSGFFSSDGNGNIGVRGDCGHVTNTISSCPGELACSGHGTCLGPSSYTCLCNEGWRGADCSEKLCPSGKAWFDLPLADNDAHGLLECSNAGMCVRTTGECLCDDGFTGASCDRMSCVADCSGHGTCSTMASLALSTTVNGDAPGWTYGEVPHKKETWDFDMVTGCFCEEGWTGHDCSYRSCASGDDIITTLKAGGGIQSHEIQTITCTATAGTFVLRFRQESTVALAYTATVAELKAALEDLSTIGQVTVTYSVPSTACTSGGSNVVSILFWDTLGDLPRLTAELDGITAMLIEADGEGISVTGTMENAVCSNRGVCDKNTGICRCFYGFSSSNGNGQAGGRGDCGFLEPIYSASAGQVVNETV